MNCIKIKIIIIYKDNFYLSQLYLIYKRNFK